MDIRQIVLFAVVVSIMGTVLGFGLSTSARDLLYLIHRPRLFARSLLAMFVMMPLIALALGWAFNFVQAVEVVLVALSISPVPPLLPRKESKAGGDASYGLGLMTLLGLLAIVIVPTMLALLERLYGRPMSVTVSAVAGPVVRVILLPLTTGMAIRAWLPALAARAEKVIPLAATVLLYASALALIVATAPAIWTLVGQGSLLAMAAFTVSGLVVGHVLGGPDHDHSTVLALSTACRHPAIALAIAVANYPGQQFVPIILLYVIVSTVVCLPYLSYQRRHAAAVIRTV